MNKRLFYYLFAVLCTVTLFTSCSDDDGDDTPTVIPIEQEIAGDYKGTMDVYYVGVPDPIASGLSQKVYVTKASDTAVKLELRDFVFSLNGEDLNLGTIAVENCPVTVEGTSYKFSGNQKMTLLVGDCDVAVAGTIGSGNLAMIVDVKVGGGTLQVKVDYKGTKLAGTESNEAKMLSFTFDKNNAANSIVIGNASLNEDNTITFVASEDATSAQLKALVPTIEVSKGGTLNAPTTIDFSRDMIYTVVSEDGGTVSTYTVKAPTMAKEPLMKYDFNTWEEVWGKFNFIVNTTEYSWDSPSPIDELACANEGIAALRTKVGGGYTGEYATVKVEGYGESGYAVKMVTLDTRGVGLAPAITPGSLFTGEFVFSFAGLNDPLSLTKFGLPYFKKPLKFKGVYKYIPGSPFIDGTDKKNPVEIEGVDAPSINAVLYEAEDEEGKEVTLTGNDINISEYRIAYATLKDEGAKSNWTSFEEDFVFEKPYVATKKYKLAIVCSSSKEGDKFKGAANSTLIVDNLEVVGE